jgi:hypothetical protein
VNETQHGQLMREWERMPLPLGAVGALLRSSDAERLHRIFTFMETTVSLALSYGLAVAYRSGRWSLPPTDLAAALDQSSLGSRAQLLQQLDCGWDLRTTNEGFRDVVRLALGPSQLPKRGEPSVAQALQAMVAARNQLAHPSIPNAIRPDAAGAVADGVVALARTNRWFGYRLLRADGFTAMPDGQRGVIATSMTGLHPAPYRGHAPIFAPEVHSVGELFLFREDGGARELCLLSPFVVARGKHVYFLADYRRGRPVMWCASHDAPAADEAMVRAVEAVLGAAAPAATSPVAAPLSTPKPSADPPNAQALSSHPSGVSGSVSAPRASRKGVVLGAGIVVGVLGICGGALTIPMSCSEEPKPMVFVPNDGLGELAPSSTATGSSPISGSSATANAPRPYDSDEALWALLRLPTRFGASTSTLAATGHVAAPRAPECPGATWTSYDLLGHAIPAATAARAWVDDELGLVEITATSDASPAALISWVQTTLGRAPTARGSDVSGCAACPWPSIGAGDRCFGSSTSRGARTSARSAANAVRRPTRAGTRIARCAHWSDH